MTDTFTEYVEKLKHTDSDLFLGRLCWYTVSGVTIAHEKLVQLLVQNNLSAFLPGVPADSDAFRRVCSHAERNRVAVTDEGDAKVYDNYLIRKMGRGDRIVAQIVRERVNASTEKVTFVTELCKLTWSKLTGTVNVQMGTFDPIADEIAKDVVKRYHAEVGTVNAYGVRELIRKVVSQMNATNVRGNGGGVYFVNHDHNARLDDLERFAASPELNDPKNGVITLVHTLPLLDDNKQREMLKRAYESEAIEELERLIEQIIDIKSSGATVTVNTVNNYIEALQRAKAKDAEYTGLLRTSLDSASSRIAILTRQVMELSARVEA